MHLRQHPAQRLAAIASNLAQQKIQRLNVRRPLVQRVDLLVADVLLNRIILAVARAAKALQRHRQQLIHLLGAVALDQRQQQVVLPL